MAPLGTKKATFLAPGKIALTRSQGLRGTFLPGGLFKSSTTSASGDVLLSHKSTSNTNKSTQNIVASVCKDNHVSNVPNVSNMNKSFTSEEGRENVNPSASNFIESHHEETLENDVSLISMNNDAQTDASEAEGDVRILMEDSATTNTVTKKRNRKPDAKPRGVNKCTKVVNLKPGQKLEIEYFNNGPVGKNQQDLSRHIGRLVRDRTICPVRVKSWNDIEESAKEHMWQSVLNKFSGKGFTLDRWTTMKQMKRLWHNWRGILHQDSIIKKGGPENAWKETPKDLTPEDWEWLVNEHFTSDAFKKVSSKNSSNRGCLTMLPRTGSRPFRQIIWEDMGVKDGNDVPPISEVFKMTRKGRSGKLAEVEAAKYDEIVDVERDNPSLSQFDVVEKCFGEQDRGSVVCFGFGVRPKDVRGPLPSRAELTTSLHEKQRENDDLRKRLDEMEKTLQEERNADKEKNECFRRKIELPCDTLY